MWRPWKRDQPTDLRDEWHGLVDELQAQNEEACDVVDEVHALLDRLRGEQRRG